MLHPEVVAIPLRGSISCNPSCGSWPGSSSSPCRNPLTGKHLLHSSVADLDQVEADIVAIPLRGSISCTHRGGGGGRAGASPRRNPLTGKHLLHSGMNDKVKAVWADAVAIPLRGSISCTRIFWVLSPGGAAPSQSPYGEASLALVELSEEANSLYLGRNPLTGKHLLHHYPVGSGLCP